MRLPENHRCSGLVVPFCFAAALSMAAAPALAGGCSPASRARNEATARIVFEEILSKGRIAENEHIYHPEFRAHGLTRDADRAEDREASEGWRLAVPDLRVDVLRTVADCAMVAVHFRGTGTNTGEGNGLPATGRKMDVEGMTFFGFKDGKIYEEWTVFDRYAMAEQLGLLGAPQE